MPWVPFSCVELPENREYCEKCHGTGMRRHRYGGSISDDDFSECNVCYGLGLKPKNIEDMSEKEIDEFMLSVHYGNSLKRCKSFDEKIALIKRYRELIDS